jgi:acyl-CoA thioesterase
MAGESGPRSETDPEQLVRLPYIEGAMPAFTQHFDYRWTATHGLFSGAKRGQLGGYVRAIDADRFDAALMLAMIDSFPAPILTMLKVPAPASTASWMVNFTHAQSKNTVEDFCRLEADTLSAGAGYASVDAKLWDAEGKLLAVSRQLVVEYSS